MLEPKLLVLGSLAYDYIMEISDDFYPSFQIDQENRRVNAALTVQNNLRRFGGTAGNISYNLGLMETPHAVVTCVGRDFMDLGYDKHLKSAYRTFWLQTEPNEYSSTCYIVNDKNNNQLIVFHEGAGKFVGNIDLAREIPKKHSLSLAINSPQNPEGMKKFARSLAEMEIPTIFDPGQVTRAFSAADLQEILPRSIMLVANEMEFDIVSNALGRSIEGILELVPQVIVTRGADGVSCYVRNRPETSIPACKPDRVEETTGAGDGFRAGMLACLVQGETMLEAARVGNVVGSFVVETKGGQTQRYTLEDVKNRYKETYGTNPEFL